MKKLMALVIAAAWAGTAMAQLYSYDSTGSETIDGVTWEYCVSNGEARVINSVVLCSGEGCCDFDYRYTDYWNHRTDYCRYMPEYSTYSAIGGAPSGAVAVPKELGG